MPKPAPKRPAAAVKRPPPAPVAKRSPAKASKPLLGKPGSQKAAKGPIGKAKPVAAKPAVVQAKVAASTNGRPKTSAKAKAPVIAAKAAPIKAAALAAKPAAAKPVKPAPVRPAAKTAAVAKPVPPPPRAVPTAAPPPPVSPSSDPVKPKKNVAGLSARDLQHFADLLLVKRREIVGDMHSMEGEALRSGPTGLSSLPVHMADMGTDNYEQEFTLGLVEKDRHLLREINHALAKIPAGTYGVCEGTGQAIGKLRLEYSPWSRFSIEYARQKERNGRGVRVVF